MKKKTLTQVALKVSVYLRYLYQDKGIRGKELLKVYPNPSKATIYRYDKKPVADRRQEPKSLPNTHSSRVILAFYYKTIES